MAYANFRLFLIFITLFSNSVALADPDQFYQQIKLLKEIQLPLDAFTRSLSRLSDDPEIIYDTLDYIFSEISNKESLRILHAYLERLNNGIQKVKNERGNTNPISIFVALIKNDPRVRAYRDKTLSGADYSASEKWYHQEAFLLFKGLPRNEQRALIVDVIRVRSTSMPLKDSFDELIEVSRFFSEAASDESSGYVSFRKLRFFILFQLLSLQLLIDPSTSDELLQKFYETKKFKDDFKHYANYFLEYCTSGYVNYHDTNAPEGWRPFEKSLAPSAL